MWELKIKWDTATGYCKINFEFRGPGGDRNPRVSVRPCFEIYTVYIFFQLPTSYMFILELCTNIIIIAAH